MGLDSFLVIFPSDKVRVLPGKSHGGMMWRSRAGRLASEEERRLKL
jgi:hypothetical protein